MWLLRQFCILLCLPLFVILFFQMDVLRLFSILRKLHKSDILSQQLKSGSCWSPPHCQFYKLLSVSFTGQETAKNGWCSIMCFEVNCCWNKSRPSYKCRWKYTNEDFAVKSVRDIKSRYTIHITSASCYYIFWYSFCLSVIYIQ